MSDLCIGGNTPEHTGPLCDQCIQDREDARTVARMGLELTNAKDCDGNLWTMDRALDYACSLLKVARALIEKDKADD